MLGWARRVEKTELDPTQQPMKNQLGGFGIFISFKSLHVCT